MKDQSKMISLNAEWMTDFSNLSHLHTMWAPLVELACISLKEELPPNWRDARRNSMFKQVSYTSFLPILERAISKPSFIPDYLVLFQADTCGWIMEFVGQQRTMKECLELFSFLSPLLDTCCVNYVVDHPEYYEVRLSHILMSDGPNALSLAIQCACVMCVVNKLYWIGKTPRDVEILIPSGDAHDMARSAVNTSLAKQRWPAHTQRWERRYAAVRVPKFNRDGGPLQLGAPLRGLAVPKGRSSPLYTEVQKALWDNKVLIDACTQRWMLNNLRYMEMDRYCQWAHIKKPTLSRKLKDIDTSWQNLKTEVRYRHHYAMLANGHSEEEIAESLGLTPREQSRWITDNRDNFRRIHQERIEKNLMSA